MISIQSRFRGSLIGLATGDALGMVVEFSRPGTFPRVTEMKSGGPFSLPAGFWTDDTSMALCLAHSIIETKSYNPEDQMFRFLRWYREGYLSSTGKCFDIGNQTRLVLDSFSDFLKKNPHQNNQNNNSKNGYPYFGGPSNSDSAGNGSLMRLCPVPLVFFNHPLKAIHFSGDSSRTTHGSAIAVDCCRYYSALIVGALSGKYSKSELLTPYFLPSDFLKDTSEDSVNCESEPFRSKWWNLHPEVSKVAGGSFLINEPPNIVGSGYVVKSMEAALWAFSKTESFAEGALLVVNLGNDSDTCAAIFGQLAGAFYGYDSIPESWKQKLHQRELLVDIADKLLDQSSSSWPGSSSYDL